MRRFGAWSVVIVVAVLAVVPAACSSSGAGSTRVVGVGDSLLRFAAPATRDQLSDHDVTLKYKDGQAIAKMLPALQSALADGTPDVVIEQLGTNDVLQRRSPAAITADFNRLITMTKPVPCVVLTTISTYLDQLRGGTNAALINAEIRRLAASDPDKYKVVDWDANLHAPEGVHRYLMVKGFTDGIHENPTGGKWFGTHYAKAVRQCGT